MDDWFQGWRSSVRTGDRWWRHVVGDLALKRFEPEVEQRVFAISKDGIQETFFEEALIAQPVYVTQYYSDGTDGHKYQIWKLTLRGRNKLHGEIEDLETGNKGVVSGYWRANTLNLSYASASADRPGFGSFVLRPYHPPLADKVTSYAGLALVHECECKDGVVGNGPILMVPAVLTSDRVVPADISSKFSTKAPVKANIAWPSDFQKTANAC